jgi:hypothetical protein
MQVRFTRLSDAQHAVAVARDDGSTDRVVLDSRSFLRHDLAHWAVESVLGLTHGVWGSVAAGGSLAGDGLDGDDVATAERIAGPVQTLIRTEAGVEAYSEVLGRAGIDDTEAAARLHEQVRRLRGHWNATAHGGSMELHWPDPG